jgi:catechol 2,3-dioxygenase-like lactoylglutathione lyase family enzyme
MNDAIKLGYAFEIAVTTPDLKRSLQFYEKLGYQRLGEPDNFASRVLLTDGFIRLALVEGDEWKGSLAYYAEDVAEKVSALERRGVRFHDKLEVDAKTVGATLVDTNGMEITLAVAQPSQLQSPPGKALSPMGQFGELSIETEDVARSLEFWLKLGFEPTQYMPAQPASWASIADGLLMVGLYGKGHCPHIIRTPSITYFEADMSERIRKLKQEGMTFKQELPGEDGKTGHAVAEAPEGQLLFLFGF